MTRGRDHMYVTTETNEYTIYEYSCKGAYSASLYLYHLLKDSFSNGLRRGGIIMFPEDVQDIDYSMLEGKWAESKALQGRFTAKDGSRYSGTSICIDVLDYPSEPLMDLAVKLCHEIHKTLIIKDFEKKRLYMLTEKEKRI